MQACEIRLIKQMLDEICINFNIVIWDTLAKCWEYVYYYFFIIQGFQNIPKNIHEKQKAQFECSNII
jgi:hypothetical protein